MRWDSATNGDRGLECFHVSSGLRVNFHKSKVFGIGTSNHETSQWANILGCVVGALPFTYLVVPIGANMNLKRNWLPVINKFRSKLSKWKSKTLSFGGRLTLVKSVLRNLPTFYLSLFKAPIGVIETLEKIRRRFLWGDNGGLGIGSIRALNIALMAKWWWRLKTEPVSLWCRTITGIHLLQNKPTEYLSKKNITGVWNNIATTKKDINSFGLSFDSVCRKIINSGNKTQFWNDVWHGTGTLKSEFPLLYVMEKKKSCTVAERITNNGPLWQWKSTPVDYGTCLELDRLNRSIAKFRIKSGSDKWTCPLDKEGRYTVASLRMKIDNIHINNSVQCKVNWSRTIPLKVICFIWRAALGRIPSAIALQHSGIHIESTLCGSCIGEQECVDHILVKCPYAYKVREQIFLWCGIDLCTAHSVGDLLKSAATWGRCPIKRECFMAICYGMIWALWKHRNNRLFQKVFYAPSIVVENVKAMSLYSVNSFYCN
uniref:Reverse transcriptase zinc-binding domain-containing protein n=1 Tax=Lactuca sativa TaxID=4236 RepID=A0A9R1US55_LACSA|nr:hypothetical protein LSAT_V11C800391510 [Lactuca sativa]